MGAREHRIVWGNSENFTIFGQSGGGAKASTLLGLLPANGLFHKTVAMSGPIVSLVEKRCANGIALQTFAKLGAFQNNVHQLQSMPVWQIIDAASAVYMPSEPGGGLAKRTLALVEDGRSIPTNLYAPAATPISRGVPLSIGSQE